MVTTINGDISDFRLCQAAVNHFLSVCYHVSANEIAVLIRLRSFQTIQMQQIVANNLQWIANNFSHYNESIIID